MTFTTSDGIALAYEAWNADAGGVPLILHHGFAASGRTNWVAPGVAAALAGAGRWVIAIDARGHGKSDKPHDPAFYGEARMARDVSELADHLGVAAFDLAGYSMGAIVALICATEDRRIGRLAIGGVGDGILARGGVDTRVVDNKDIVHALLTDELSTIAPSARGFRQLADAVGADRRALAAQAQRVHAEPIPLDRIAARTLVLAGTEDPLAARPERLAAAIPGAVFRSVPGDHRSAVAVPQFAAALVEFFA